ncbi:DUF3037 domain-containing protein [Photobacterium toruni]|uniref:DUF3037 domain-containing protein n=1 Tax=Photobacterium toruni TaxID=1935446 RepID=A0A1T4UJ66_9GAMM|nr:DUF3037 domain-containing protein [Photobacterium toruni]SKA52714.1 hypothetical protein CZ814_03333 [Photobacterium toruni]
MSMGCLYAIIRFAPYAETGEFANVGIVLCVPKTKFFDFKLAPVKFKRISQFFDDIDNKLFAATISNIEQELGRIRNFAGSSGEDKIADIFKELTRDRESIIRFGEIRSTLLKTHPNDLIETLYERFIGRDFVTKQYREAAMVRAIRQELRVKGMPAYTEGKVSNDLIEATFPFVNNDNGPKIIKPLTFQQPTTTKIIEHGEFWHWKVKRLIKAGSLESDNILLPFESPVTTNIQLHKAYQEVVNEFNAINVNVTNFSDTTALLEFATRDLGPEKFQLR